MENAITNTMKNNVEYKHLLDYISNVITLESSLYEQNKLYQTLNDKKVSLERKNTDEPYHNYQKYPFDSDSLASIGFFGIIGFFSGLILTYATKDSSFISICCIIGLMIGLIIFGWNLFAVYSNNKKIKDENFDITLMNSVRHTEKLNRIAFLKREMSRIHSNYNETKEILDKIYNTNTIYYKYRSFPAMCTIYEYLCSERCYHLKGPDGAYNIYESELRMNIIIGKLDNIIEKLDIVAENQRMLHSEITKGNQMAAQISARISSLSKKFDNISGTLQDISGYEQVNAYYNKVSAQNSEFNTWYTIINS